jgi:hypothetical protein
MAFTFNKKTVSTQAAVLVKANPQSVTVVNTEFIEINLSANDLLTNFPLKFFIKSGQPLLKGKLFNSLGTQINTDSETDIQLPNRKIIYKPFNTHIGLELLRFYVKTEPPINSNTPPVQSLTANITITIMPAVDNNTQTADLDFTKLIESFNSNKKPQILMSTEFKTLFDNLGNKTEIGTAFFENFSKTVNINRTIKAFFKHSSHLNSPKLNLNKSEFYENIGQISNEVNYLKDLNKAVFDAVNSVNFIDSGFNRNGIIFRGAKNSIAANNFFGTTQGSFEEIKDIIPDFTVRDFLSELGYDNIDNEIKNRLSNSPTKVFLLILELTRILYSNHHMIGIKKNQLSIDYNNFLLKPDLHSSLSGFASSIIANTFDLSSVSSLKNLSTGVDFNVFTELMDKIDTRMNNLSSDRIEKNNAKLQIALNDIGLSQISNNPIENDQFLSSYVGGTSNSLSNVFDKNLFGSYSEDLKFNDSLSNNSLQKLAISINSNSEKILNLEAYDEFVENDSKFSLTAKSEYIKKSINLTKNEHNYSFSPENIKNRMSEINNIMTAYRNFVIFNDTITNAKLQNVQNISQLKDINAYNLLLNIENFFIKNDPVVFPNSPTPPPSPFSFQDNSLFLMKIAKVQKNIKINLFLFCLYHVVKNNIPQGSIGAVNDLIFIKSKINEYAAKIKNEANIVANPRFNDETQDKYLVHINTVFDSLFTENLPSSIRYLINVMTKFFQLSNNSSSTILMSFSNSAKTINLFLIFDSIIDIIDLLFDIKITKKIFNNITVAQNIKSESERIFEIIKNNGKKSLKLKFMSFSFLNKVSEDIRTTYETLNQLISNSANSRFNLEFKPGLEYIFTNLGIASLGENFLNIIVDDNNIDKSVKNMEYIKTKSQKSGRPNIFFDSMFELSQNNFMQSNLELFFKDQLFLNNEFYNKKILTIGLPPGFIKNIKTQISKESKTIVDPTVIQINLYKTDLRYPEIILKPKKYLFETSRYIDEQRITSYKATEFFKFEYFPMVNMIKGSNILSDLEDLYFTKTFSSQVHAFLSDQHKKEIFKNHIIDYLLRIYLRNFNNASRHFNDDNLSALNISNYISNNRQSISLEEFTSRILDPLRIFNLSDTEKERLKLSFYNYFSNISNLLFARDYIYLPKRFDRIFNILVDPDDFYIDLKISKELNFQDDENKLNDYLLGIDKIRNLSDGVKLPSVSPENGDIVFDQYIFDIELL